MTRNNLEAAEEIVRQLRLRDIGGIVIIDFVDMVLESNRDLVLRRLVECLGRDRTRHQVTEITSLGLVQMTRKRVGEGLVEAFSSPCEACEGRGFIVHHHPVETSGAEQSPKGSKGSKKQQKKAEPRRLEDNADHERAKEALSAIAAASTRKEEESSTEESTPAKKRRSRTATAEAHEPEASTAAQEALIEADAEAAAESIVPKPLVAQAEEAGIKRPRRRRRVAESAPLPDLPVHIERSSEPAAPVKDASEIQMPEHREKAPATRRRASRKAVTATSSEPAEAPAPAKARRRATAQTAVPEEHAVVSEAQADNTPATASAAVTVVEETHAQEPAAPRKTRRRRAAVSTGVVEPDAAPAPIVVDLPARAEASAPAAPVRSTEDITLPEASDQPRVKRRRRAASTGIVDAG